MLKRLQTDPSLARYAGWFIPLKIDTSGEDWRKWASQYRHEGNSIPIVFVVRADGEQLYGKSGSLPGPALPMMIEQTLAQAGTIYNDGQLATLATAVEKAKEAVAAEDYAAAVPYLAGLTKLGTLGSLGSYAQPALEADALVAEMVEQARTKLAPIQQQLASESSRLDGALALMELRRVYLQLPAAREDIQSALDAAKANPELRDTLAVAQQLDEARGWIGKPNGQRRATAILTRVLREHAETPAAELAARWLLENYPDQVGGEEGMGTGSPPVPDGLPTWTSDTGHSLQAALVGYGFDEATKTAYVVLKPAEGDSIQVGFDRLDAKSQAQAKQLVRQLQESK